METYYNYSTTGQILKGQLTQNKQCHLVTLISFQIHFVFTNVQQVLSLQA